jgi:hypothetical protein
VPGLVPPAPDGDLAIVVRPENLELRPDGAADAGWRGTVAFVTPLGATLDYEIDIGRDLPLRVVTMRPAGTSGLAVGAPVIVTVKGAEVAEQEPLETVTVKVPEPLTTIDCVCAPFDQR